MSELSEKIKASYVDGLARGHKAVDGYAEALGVCEQLAAAVATAIEETREEGEDFPDVAVIELAGDSGTVGWAVEKNQIRLVSLLPSPVGGWPVTMTIMDGGAEMPSGVAYSSDVLTDVVVSLVGEAGFWEEVSEGIEERKPV